MFFCRIPWIQGRLSPLCKVQYDQNISINIYLFRLNFPNRFTSHNWYFAFYLSFGSLFFIVGSRLSKDGNDNPENELGLLEFIHNLVETMDKWAGSICELDIMYQLEQVHFLLDEMVMNGYIIETNKMNVLRPLDLMERESQKAESMYKWRMTVERKWLLRIRICKLNDRFEKICYWELVVKLVLSSVPFRSWCQCVWFLSLSSETLRNNRWDLPEDSDFIQKTTATPCK